MITEQGKIKRNSQPIKSAGEIANIRSVISDRPRDLLLFDLAVGTGIGMKKLLHLKVRDLAGKKVSEKISLRAGRSKTCSFTMTHDIYETFNNYLKACERQEHEFLFKSMKGPGPLNLSTVSNLVKGWFKKANIESCSGAISLRKTWEYNQKMTSGADRKVVTAEHPYVYKPFPKALTIQQTVFNELVGAIISHKIPPGSRITTNQISKAFKVGKAPVRVAMNWLEARGFIIAQKKGSLVKQLDVKEMIEILRIRSYLETAAAKLAYKVRTEETLNELESIIKRYENADEFDERDRMNTLFHITLYRDIGMPLLISLIVDLCNRLSPYVILHLSCLQNKPGHSKDTLDATYYQRNILDGMRKKDIGQVLKFLKGKLARGERYMTELMRNA